VILLVPCARIDVVIFSRRGFALPGRVVPVKVPSGRESALDPIGYVAACVIWPHSACRKCDGARQVPFTDRLELAAGLRASRPSRAG
jgi:hypothetical protein